MKIKVLIADDHTIVRAGLTALLGTEKDIEVVGEAKNGAEAVSEAIKLAKNLNMRIVAEGVEIKEQVDFLASEGCDMIQGYYFAKPMPSDDYEKRMSQ